MLWLTGRRLKSKNPVVRRKVVAQLGQAPQPQAIRVLALALADEDREVRRLAAMALGKIEDERCLEPLKAAMQDPDGEVVKAAILSLRKTPNAVTMIPALTPLLRHRDTGVRGHAAQMLEMLGWRPTQIEDEIWFLVAKGYFQRVIGFGARAVPALEVALASGPSSFAVGAVDALGQIGDREVLRSLVRALKSGDPAVSVAASYALAQLGDAQAVEPLVGLLRHENSQVRSAAVEALGRLRAINALESMSLLLADRVWEVRREAAEALGRMRDRRAVEALSSSLRDQDADVRETTALALGKLGDRLAIRSLVLALKDPASGVRRIAAAALSRIDPDWSASAEAQMAVEELRLGLQDEDPNIRYFVGQLLVSLGAMDASAVPAAEPAESLASTPAKRRRLAITLFSTVLCDVDRDLRQAAAEALGRLGDARAQTALRRAQTDEDPGVRSAVEQALQTLGTASA